MHLRQPGFTYSDCEPFTKNNQRLKQVNKTYIYIWYSPLKEF